MRLHGFSEVMPLFRGRMGKRFIMIVSLVSRGAFFGGIAALSLVTLDGAFAAAQNYRFEVVKVQPVAPDKTEVAIKLVHLPDGKPVADAVIFENKIDMGPSGMAEMTGKVTPEPTEQPGVYRFQTETGMAGTWALHLAAKVQGEAETVRDTVTIGIPQ